MPGLHRFIEEVVLASNRPSGRRALELGTGNGGFASRLASQGYEVTACDQDLSTFEPDLPGIELNLDEPSFPDILGRHGFDLVAALEVIEHLESPIQFLRGVASLLSGNGLAIVTTPNVDSLPARAKHLLKGTIRLFDRYGDPTHLSPIFWDLLLRQYLPRAGLILVDHHVFPPMGFAVGNRRYSPALRLVGPLLAHRPTLSGDVHVFVLRRP